MNADTTTEWRGVTGCQIPAPSEIQVWRINLDCQPFEPARWQAGLAAEERMRAADFKFARDQRRFIIRRAVLRQLLGKCLATSPLAVRMESGSNGKPAIAGQRGPEGIRFSCSHSGDWALIAIARGIEMGVDLERHRDLPDAEDLTRAFFSEVEIRALAALPATKKTAGFFNCWTRKEAFVKAIGLGLSFPLNQFAVSLAPDAPAAILSMPENIGESIEWSMISLNVAPEYSAALAFAKPRADIKLLEWTSHLGW